MIQVVVPKAKGEILGVVIVESGWGSMLPTIVLANLLPTGPAARCGQLNIGDQVRKKTPHLCILCHYFTYFFHITGYCYKWHIASWSSFVHLPNLYQGEI